MLSLQLRHRLRRACGASRCCPYSPRSHRLSSPWPWTDALATASGLFASTFTFRNPGTVRVSAGAPLFRGARRFRPVTSASPGSSFSDRAHPRRRPGLRLPCARRVDPRSSGHWIRCRYGCHPARDKVRRDPAELSGQQDCPGGAAANFPIAPVGRCVAAGAGYSHTGTTWRACRDSWRTCNPCSHWVTAAHVGEQPDRRVWRSSGTSRSPASESTNSSPGGRRSARQ